MSVTRALVACLALSHGAGCSLLSKGADDARPWTDGGGPAQTDATIASAIPLTLPAPTLGATQRIDSAGDATSPRVFAINGELYLLYSVGQARALTLRRRLASGSLSQEVSVGGAGSPGDLVHAGNALLMVSVFGPTTTVRRSSGLDGASWSVERSFPAADSHTCQELSSRFFRPASGALHLALGFNHDTQIFGCAAEGHLTSAQGSAWTAPRKAGLKGPPTGAFIVGKRRVYASDGGIHFSDDGGSAYTQVAVSGSYTKDQIRASDMALSQSTLIATHPYSWGKDSPHHIDLLDSADGGKTWSRRNLLRSAANLFEPQIAADGKNIAVLWRSSGHQLVYSDDGGASFSRPVALLAGSAPHLAVTGRQAWVALQTATKQIELVDASW